MNLLWGGSEDPIVGRTEAVSVRMGQVAQTNPTHTNASHEQLGPAGQAIQGLTNLGEAAGASVCAPSEERPSFRRFARYLLSNETSRLPPSHGSDMSGQSVSCGPAPSTRRLKSRLGNTIYKMMDSGVVEDFEQLTLVKRPNVLQRNNNILNNPNKVVDGTPPRVVALTNICVTMSMANLLTQVYGGALERVEVHRRDNFQIVTPSQINSFKASTVAPTDWTKLDICLYFHKAEDAQDFFNYSKTGMFVVNGTHLDTHWVHYEEELGDEYHVLDRMEDSGGKARRVLVFKRPVLNKRHRTAYERRHWPDPHAHFTANFNYEEVRSDFESYGGLVEVMPVISRKTCFGVHFLDVRTAMKVKRVIQANPEDGTVVANYNERDTALYNKYKDWYVWFGSDPCDKAVIL